MVALKTLVFSILVPGTVAGGIPWLLLQGSGDLGLMFPSVWMVGLLPILMGVGLYLWCGGYSPSLGKERQRPSMRRKSWLCRASIGGSATRCMSLCLRW